MTTINGNTIMITVPVETVRRDHIEVEFALSPEIITLHIQCAGCGAQLPYTSADLPIVDYKHCEIDVWTIKWEES